MMQHNGSDSSSLPLHGIRVLDLSRLLPGGYATMQLASFGADVIKIEDPRGGDPARWSEPSQDGISLYFAALNRNKRSISIDLKQSAGREALLRLVDVADVLVESFRPGVMDRLGLGQQALLLRNPRLVYCAITGYGQTGSASTIAGHDLNFMGYAGLLDLSRQEDGTPVLPPTQFADLAGGALPAAIGILLTLFGREQTGCGGIVDIAMMESMLALQPLFSTAVLAMHRPIAATESQLHGGDPAYGIYETADHRYVTLAALETRFWRRFCELINRPDLSLLHGFHLGARKEYVRAEVKKIFAAQSLAYWMNLLAAEDTCVGPVLTLDEALQSRDVRAHDVVRQVNLGEREGNVVETVPRLVTLDRQELPPPKLGEHTRQVLAEVGYSNAELTEMLQNRIIADGTTSY